MFKHQKTEAQINKLRDQYRVVATRGAIIYFVIADLANIDPMYQYSLDYFISRFNYCIDTADKNEDVQVRLGTLIDFTTLFMYNNICRGLFERDKMMFSFILCAQIMLKRESISTSNWMLFLRGAQIRDRSDQKPNPDTSNRVLSQKGWDFLNDLSLHEKSFKGIHDSVEQNWDAWRSWSESAQR